MILLDTDHLTALKYREHPRCRALCERMEAAGWSEMAITVVNVEEQLRGWLAEIAKPNIRDQVTPYSKLAALFDYLGKWPIITFDVRAADTFEMLRRRKVRIGTMDLKIADIALTNDALLLSANLRDCRKEPGLRVENWLRA